MSGIQPKEIHSSFVVSTPFPMNRRHCLGTTLAALVASLPVMAEGKRRPRILLRNAWQSMNIGDIAHYMGMLELMEKFGIDAEVRLWPSNLENEADQLLARNFPKVTVVKSKEDIATAIQECDFFLHGSCSGFGAWKDVARWVKETGKPFGVCGISITSTEPELIETLSKASFVFFRDSVSMGLAKEHGCTAPIMEFGPDTAFGILKLRDDVKAAAFLKEHDLQEGKFLCCIPRWRTTPAWTVYKARKYSGKHRQEEPGNEGARPCAAAGGDHRGGARDEDEGAGDRWSDQTCRSSWARRSWWTCCRRT